MKKAAVFLLYAIIIIIQATGCRKETEKPGRIKEQADDGPADTIHLVIERPLWSNSDPTGEYAQSIREEIKKTLDIDVKIVGQFDPSDINEKPKLMLMAGEQLDIFQSGADAVLGWRMYKDEGLIIPLNELMDNHGEELRNAVDPLSWPLLTDESGVIWALPDECPAVTRCLFIRQDWLDKAGLQIPKTWDEYELVCQSFKEQFGDIGFVTITDRAEELVFLGAFVDHLSVFTDSDGMLKPVYAQDGYRDYLNKMAEWYTKGYLNKEIRTMDYSRAMSLMRSGRTGLMMDWMGAYGLSLDEQVIRANAPEARLSPLAPPSGPKRGKIAAGSTVSAHIMITKSCQNPEAAMKFINWSMATDEGWALCKYGIEGMHYKVEDAETGLISIIGEFNYPIYCTTRLNAFAGKLLTDISSVYVHNFYQDVNRYPHYVPETLGLLFDYVALKPYSDKLLPLDNEMNELYTKIVIGEADISQWDIMLDHYMANGGSDYYNELTRQFKSRQQ